MSAREWKPGEVGIIKFSAGDERGMWDGEKWLVTGGRSALPNYSIARPLVVIDPENREQVDALCKALVEAMYRAGDSSGAAQGVHPDRLAAALREFANPTPPRMDEPGTWGVVKAACVHADERRTWMRHEDDNWYVVGTDTKNNPDDWDSLVDPVLVREGVTA